MNVLKRLLMAVMCLFITFATFAQVRQITGTVLSQDDNTPLLGVTITNRATNQKVQTDASGKYTINAEKGQVLVFSYVGFNNQEVRVGDNNTVSPRLVSSQAQLSEVVVTAMDIKRNPRELGYSVQKVNGDEIAQTQRENFLNSLQGRVAGATITPSGGIAGASSQIVLRGFNSMALDNQPLFVIDGVVVDNQTINETSNGGSSLGLASDRANRGNDYSNRISDINPNDIESITILKGPEATALYGSQASSGAIIITTKKANTNGKVLVSYDNSFRFQKLTRFPSSISKFDAGTNGAPENTFSYFGPAYEPGTQLYNNVDHFFQTGFGQTHNISLETGKQNRSFRFSGSYLDQGSTVPGNSYKRYNARVSNSTKIGKYVEIMPSFSLISSSNDKPLRGANGYLLNLLIWPADNDIRDWQDPNGNKKSAYNASNLNSEFDNPFFNAYKNRSYDQTNRFIGTFGINVNPFEWLSLAGRFGYDTYKSEGYTFYHPTSFYVSQAQGGALDNYYRRYYGYNHTLTATARKKIGDFTGRLMVGNMWQNNETQMYSVYGTNLKDSSSTDSSNTREITRVRLSNSRKGLPNYSINRQAAYFGEASVGYKNAVFLTYTHRFEESSIFPKQSRNYNYPAGSLSVILSDLVPAIKGNILSYAKLRTSLASTARSSAPYRNQSVFNPYLGSGGGFAYGNDNNNYYLTPERQRTYEIGTELRFLNSRISLDATYYNTLNSDQIVEGFRASYGTGFILNTLNVGSTQNEGVEISVDATPIQNKNFRWNVRLNFNKMWNKVVSLPANVPEFYLSDTWLYGNARGGLVVGGPTTSITSYGYQRDSVRGEILIDPANGMPLVDQTFKLRGDRNPDFTLGFVNNLTYKNWKLNFLWDLKMGGDIFNGTEMYLTTRGRSLRTEDRTTPRIVNGILKDGLENTANPTRNTIVLNPYYSQLYYTARLPEEEFIERDVNWLRLRDISLNYTFSPQIIKSLKVIRSLSAFISGTDLILITNYTGADPQVNGNTAGSRGVGAFGFDYGNIGMPASFNFGIRANF